MHTLLLIGSYKSYFLIPKYGIPQNEIATRKFQKEIFYAIGIWWRDNRIGRH